MEEHIIVVEWFNEEDLNHKMNEELLKHTGKPMTHYYKLPRRHGKKLVLCTQDLTWHFIMKKEDI